MPVQRKRKGRQGRPRRARRPWARRVARWLPWAVGGVLLAALVAAALHYSEGREFLRLAQDAEPWWLLVAGDLQAATYLAQGEVYRAVGRAARSPLPITLAYQLSLSKLFVDSAIPSGGISGTVIVARSLGVARNPLLLLEASAYQLAIIVLDVATIWVPILALGATGSLPGVFASFMIATPFRTIGVLPGGLGSFEVVSVLTLRMARVGIPVALAATLLFRGLSFWLPMLPGLWFSRHVVTEARRQT